MSANWPVSKPKPGAEPSGPFRPPVQWAVAFLLGIGATVVAVRALHVGGARPTERVAVVSLVDLNHAGRAELMQLPGVGERTADKIMAERDRRGGFEKRDDLRGVKGIGPTRMDALRPFVGAGEESMLAGIPERAMKPESPFRSDGGKKPALPPDVLIDVNRASLAELQRLPGIGPVLAERIVTEREKGRFRKADDLRRVPGIGPKTLEKLRPHISVGDDRVAVSP